RTDVSWLQLFPNRSHFSERTARSGDIPFQGTFRRIAPRPPFWRCFVVQTILTSTRVAKTGNAHLCRRVAPGDYPLAQPGSRAGSSASISPVQEKNSPVPAVVLPLCSSPPPLPARIPLRPPRPRLVHWPVLITGGVLSVLFMTGMTLAVWLMSHPSRETKDPS